MSEAYPASASTVPDEMTGFSTDLPDPEVTVNGNSQNTLPRIKRGWRVDRETALAHKLHYYAKPLIGSEPERNVGLRVVNPSRNSGIVKAADAERQARAAAITARLRSRQIPAGSPLTHSEPAVNTPLPDEVRIGKERELAKDRSLMSTLLLNKHGAQESPQGNNGEQGEQREAMIDAESILTRVRKCGGKHGDSFYTILKSSNFFEKTPLFEHLVEGLGLIANELANAAELDPLLPAGVFFAAIIESCTGLPNVLRHSVDIARNSKSYCHLNQFSEQQTAYVVVNALLHDVGKGRVSFEEVLTKLIKKDSKGISAVLRKSQSISAAALQTGLLNPSEASKVCQKKIFDDHCEVDDMERATMQEHAEAGYNFLNAKIGEFITTQNLPPDQARGLKKHLLRYCEAALTHHAAPMYQDSIAANIVTVFDAYESMRYRPNRGGENVGVYDTQRRIMEFVKYTSEKIQFPPDIVAFFFKLWKEKHYQDSPLFSVNFEPWDKKKLISFGESVDEYVREALLPNLCQICPHLADLTEAEKDEIATELTANLQHEFDIQEHAARNGQKAEPFNLEILALTNGTNFLRVQSTHLCRMQKLKNRAKNPGEWLPGHVAYIEALRDSQDTDGLERAILDLMSSTPETLDGLQALVRAVVRDFYELPEMDPEAEMGFLVNGKRVIIRNTRTAMSTALPN